MTKNGTKVVVEARNGSSWLINGPASYTYTGTVVETPSWISSDTIAITTGIPFFPMRLIARANVISIKDLTGADIALPTAAVAEKSKTWTVKGSKGDEHVVTKQGTVWGCTCKGFMFRRSCAHIVAKQNNG